ncbi:MAG: phosphate/phosphite/phosphonate ABC transporter substrate-binding protein [Pseudobdellovibrio sp.]
MKKIAITTVVFSILAVVNIFLGCTKNTAELGSEKNPIKLHFVPSIDSKIIEDNSKKFKDYLEKVTPYKYDVTIPQSFVAIVEAFGTKRADVAAINTFGYMLAHDKYQVEARLIVIRNGSATYQSQFIAKTNGKIKKIEDLAGKKIAFVDASSTSGYLLPLKTLKDKKIEPKEIMFAQKHDNVVSMVYQGQVDAGATFYSAPSKDKNGNDHIEDARRLVLTQYPDIEKKVSIISLSEPIPNDPIIFRKEMPEEMKKQIAAAMLSFVSTAEGKEAFNAIYGVTELQLATDADYDLVRAMLKTLGKEASDFK